MVGLVPQVHAQASLLGVGPDTQVRSIRFIFEGDHSVSTASLGGLLATRAPRLQDRLPWPFSSDRTQFLLDPVELQRDVVRLRSHLQATGFLHAQVDYAASTYDARKDAVRIRFTVRLGPPVIIQDVGFFTLDGYLASAFEGEMRDRWIAFRDQTAFKTGDRYTVFRVVQIEDQVLSWLKEQSYAFATLYTATTIDSVHSTADIDFLVDPGPPGTVSQIDIEGIRRVSQRLVLRELPIRVGDPFSSRPLIRGQQKLFALNLFQIAQVHVPPQERDSTVTVRVDLREARLRYLSSETGYNQRSGLWGEGRWSHRNFLGGARVLAASAELRTGILASVPSLSSRLMRASVALTQPYFVVRELVAVFEPYLQFEGDPLLLDTDQPFGINRREYGLNSTLIHGLQTTRTFSLQYNVGQATTFSRALTGDARDSYDKGVLTLAGTVGWTANLLNPRRGYTVRSSIENAGGLQRLMGFQETGLDYMKLNMEVSGFIPVTQDLFIGMRVSAGRLWPYHDQAVTLFTTGGRARYEAQFAAPTEERYDPIRFYAGGGDVRGWGPGLVGPKVNRTTFVTDDTGEVVYDGDTPATTSERYEPVGGLSRVAGGMEFWYRLGGPWRMALFLDAGQVSAVVSEMPDCDPVAYRGEALIERVDVQCGLEDKGQIDWRSLRFGTGVGIRYETPIGFVRLDIATKINPDALDLQSPRNAFLAQQGLSEVNRNQLNRLGIHISIGQAF